MSQMAIEVANVTKTYTRGDSKISVLSDINLKIKKGEFASVMGPSGSGKSTLLYLMGGLDKVSKGKIFINGKDISTLNDNSESAMRRKRIGFVFQNYNLIENLSVEENVLLPALLDGRDKKVMKMKLDDLLKAVGLADRKKHTPKELSGGQQQRTAIARALINSPSILFTDEPTGNFDSKTGNEILELIRNINVEHKLTIVMVTHDNESTKYGTRIIRLKDGCLVI
jgi:putative ABC transport system ATP-binding protein